MTEKEKRLSGQIYNSEDPLLREERRRPVWLPANITG